MPKMLNVFPPTFLETRAQAEALAETLQNKGAITYTQAPVMRDAIARRLPGVVSIDLRTMKGIIYMTIGAERLRVNNRAKLLIN